MKTKLKEVVLIIIFKSYFYFKNNKIIHIKRRIQI